MGDIAQSAGIGDSEETLVDLQIDNLPKILNYDDEKVPILVETRERLIETAKHRGPDKAEGAAITYEKIAEEHLGDQLDESRRNAPADDYERQIVKARGGLLINIARIWRDAGAREKCLEALERAIRYARENRWASVATALETERRKLTGPGGLRTSM